MRRRGVRARKRRLNNGGANNEREGHREREALCIKEKLFMHSPPFDATMPRMCAPLGELIFLPPGARTDPKSRSEQKLERGHSVCVWLTACRKKRNSVTCTHTCRIPFISMKFALNLCPVFFRQTSEPCQFSKRWAVARLFIETLLPYGGLCAYGGLWLSNMLQKQLKTVAVQKIDSS